MCCLRAHARTRPHKYLCRPNSLNAAAATRTIRCTRMMLRIRLHGGFQVKAHIVSHQHSVILTAELRCSRALPNRLSPHPRPSLLSAGRPAQGLGWAQSASPLTASRAPNDVNKLHIRMSFRNSSVTHPHATTASSVNAHHELNYACVRVCVCVACTHCNFLCVRVFVDVIVKYKFICASAGMFGCWRRGPRA